MTFEKLIAAFIQRSGGVNVVSRKLCVHRATLHRWTVGHTRPSADQIAKLVSIGMDPREVMHALLRG